MFQATLAGLNLISESKMWKQLCCHRGQGQVESHNRGVLHKQLWELFSHVFSVCWRTGTPCGMEMREFGTTQLPPNDDT